MAEKAKLPADVVEYFLFPEISSDLDSEETLERETDSYFAFLSCWLVDYIWQSGSFQLTTVKGDCDTPAHLHGTTHYGDNVEDEWFIVFLLTQLTKQFPGLIVRIIDSDEEFMLIEAADVLPKWLNPETAENRVYIYNGDLHVIPIPQSPADVTYLPLFTPSISDAVACVREHSATTRSDDKIQRAIHSRIKCFPEHIVENVQHSKCYVPAAIVAILEQNPCLVSAAVDAFYHRDPVDLKACRTMQYFRPGTRVMARVKFTRCLYAQLMQQNFTADKRSGFTLPSANNVNHKAHELGMKLAHGFEILCNRCKSHPGGDSSIRTSDSADVRWSRYVTSLEQRGYFRQQLEGSKLYKELLENARKFYDETVLTKNGYSHDPSQQVTQLLQSLTYDIEKLRQLESSVPNSDDDSWLDIKPEQLEAMLNKSRKPDIAPKPAVDLQQLADSMKSFVDNVSSHEGAEFPDEMDDPSDIQFDSTGFIHAMQKMFEFEDDKNSSSGSDMDEYDWSSDSDSNLPSPPPVPKPRTAKSKKAAAKTIDDYMAIMDKELAKTKLGKSFERGSQSAPNTPKRTVPQVNGHLPASKLSQTPKPAKSRSIDDEDDDFKPVNIDVNTVKNMLESYSAQQGLPGPASNILHSMGIALPPNSDGDARVPRGKPK